MYIDGEKIREYREEHGITIDEMSDILGMDGEELYLYENGMRWYTEDAFVIYTISSMFDELDFIPFANIDELYESL